MLRCLALCLRRHRRRRKSYRARDLFLRHLVSAIVAAREYHHWLGRIGLRYLTTLRHKPLWVLEVLQLLRRNSRELYDFGIDPSLRVDRITFRSRELEHDSFWSAKVDRFAETVVERTHHPISMRAHAVAHREQVCFGVDVERDVLHRARRHVRPGPLRIRHPYLRLYLATLRILHTHDPQPSAVPY